MIKKLVKKTLTQRERRQIGAEISRLVDLLDGPEAEAAAAKLIEITRALIEANRADENLRKACA